MRADKPSGPSLTGPEMTARRIRHLIARSEGFAPDGYYRRVDYDWAKSTRKYEAMYGDGSLYTHLAGVPKSYLERSLRDLDRWGDPPVIVLTPMHPKLERELGPVGWSACHRELVAYLRRLRSEHAFRFLDFTSIRSFGGSAHGFYDPVHMRAGNLHRMLRAVLRRAAGALSQLRVPVRLPAGGAARMVGAPAAAARLAFLTASSYVFYAWWDWRFLPLMIASTTVD